MGMEDRDWYREKRIDWKRGGLRERAKKKYPSKYIVWILAAIIAITVIWYWKGLGTAL
jgi:hypothetical protein